MAELTKKLVTDYFAGIWSCQVFINGELTYDIGFKLTEESGKFSVPSVKLEYWLLPDSGNKQEKNNQVIVAWRSDKLSWVNMWYNESGGYSEQQWTSQEEVNGITVLYGSLRERTTDGGLPTEYIAMCELTNRDNFKYTTLSYRKGILEMVAKRTGTIHEMDTITDKQKKMVNLQPEEKEKQFNINN
jgi:hypothetical protein